MSQLSCTELLLRHCASQPPKTSSPGWKSLTPVHWVALQAAAGIQVLLSPNFFHLALRGSSLDHCSTGHPLMPSCHFSESSKHAFVVLCHFCFATSLLPWVAVMLLVMLGGGLGAVKGRPWIQVGSSEGSRSLPTSGSSGGGTGSLGFLLS